MIPKIIHQIWLGDKNKMPFKLMNTVREIHSEWNYFLWTEENIGELINSKIYLSIMNSNKSFNDKYSKLADLIRYEKLFQHGGIYIDADSICNKSFNSLLDNEIFVGYENEGKRPGIIANGVIGTISNHPIFKICIEKIKSNNISKILIEPAFKVTGPYFLTKIINDYGLNNIKIYPSWYFYPVHYSGNVPNKDIDPYVDSYTNQLWASTDKGFLSMVKRIVKKFS